MKLTTEQLAVLLHKSRTQPCRNQKRFLMDLGGDGSAEELDQFLAIAQGKPDVVAQADRIYLQRAIT